MGLAGLQPPAIQFPSPLSQLQGLALPGKGLLLGLLLSEELGGGERLPGWGCRGGTGVSLPPVLPLHTSNKDWAWPGPWSSAPNTQPYVAKSDTQEHSHRSERNGPEHHVSRTIVQWECAEWRRKGRLLVTRSESRRQECKEDQVETGSAAFEMKSSAAKSTEAFTRERKERGWDTGGRWAPTQSASMLTAECGRGEGARAQDAYPEMGKGLQPTRGDKTLAGRRCTGTMLLPHSRPLFPSGGVCLHQAVRTAFLPIHTVSDHCLEELLANDHEPCPQEDLLSP